MYVQSTMFDSQRNTNYNYIPFFIPPEIPNFRVKENEFGNFSFGPYFSILWAIMIHKSLLLRIHFFLDTCYDVLYSTSIKVVSMKALTVFRLLVGFRFGGTFLGFQTCYYLIESFSWHSMTISITIKDPLPLVQALLAVHVKTRALSRHGQRLFLVNVCIDRV